MERWDSLSILLFGHVNSFNFFYIRFRLSEQSSSWCRGVDVCRGVDGFVWKGNILQVKLKSQHRLFCKRGLQFPNFCLFYCAVQIRAGWIWQAEYADSPVWQRLEESQIEGVLAAAPFIPPSYCVESYCQSIIITCKVWTDIKKKFNCKQIRFTVDLSHLILVVFYTTCSYRWNRLSCFISYLHRKTEQLLFIYKKKKIIRIHFGYLF